MASLSDFGIAPPNPTAYYAPTASDNAPVPTYQAPQLPAVQNFNVPTQPAQPISPTASPTHPIPTLADIIGSTEAKQGKPLTKEEFSDLAGWYRSNVASPMFWNQKGATKAKVDAELQSFDDQVNREQGRRYSTSQPQAGGQDNGWMAALAQAAKGGLERGGAGAAVIAGGVVNAAADRLNAIRKFFGNGLTDDQAHELGDYIFRQANPDIQGNLLNSGNQDIQAAYSSGHPIAATSGLIAGQLLPFLFTRGAGTAALAAGEAATNVGAHSAEQLHGGESLGKVEAQAIPDAVLETLAAYLPTRFAGKALARAVKGGTTAGGVAAAQQIIDKAINDKNQVSPGSVGVATGLGALIGALHGSGISKIVDRFNKPANETPLVKPKTPNAKTKQAAQESVEEPDLSPQESYTQALNENPSTEGLADNEFERLNNGLSKRADVFAKKYKVGFKYDNPDDLIASAVTFAKQLSGDNFAKMTSDQRDAYIGNIAAWIAKRSKTDPAEVSDALVRMKQSTPESPVTREPPVTPETPAAQETQPAVTEPAPVKPSAETPAAEPVYQPEERYNGLWSAVSTSTTPISELPAEVRQLAGLVRSGRIPDRQTFDKVVQDAENRKANPLKSAPKTEAPAQEPPKPSPLAKSNAKSSDAVDATDTNRLASDVLKGRSNKTSEVELRRMVRGLLDEAGQSGVAKKDLAPLKQMTVKDLIDHVKSLKQKKILAKTKIEPTSNPDEVTPVPKNKLKAKPKKQAEPKQEDTGAAEAAAYASEHKIPDMFMSSVREAHGLTPEEVGAVWNRYKEAGLVKQDKLNRNNFKLQNDALAKEKMIRSTLEQAREDGDIAKPGGKPPPKPEAPAKENAGANKQTPLEKLLQERLGDRLPRNRLDEIHDAVETAQTGDKNELTDLVQGLIDSGDVTKNEAKWLNGLPKRNIHHDLVENNASGESAASLEAQHRLADERAQGRTRAIIRRNDTVEPMVGVDAVDVHARAGEVVVQRGIGAKADEWTILSHGDDLSKDAAIGKINRVKSKLNKIHEESQARPSEKENEIPENTISLDEAETLHADRAKNMEGTVNEPDRIAPLNVKRTVDSIIEKIQKGSDVREVGMELHELSDSIAAKNLERKLNEFSKGRRRGPEWVKARLQRLIADSDPQSDHAIAAKMAQWLIDKNPAIADRLGITINSKIEGAGFYDPFTKLLGLNDKSLNTTTGLHELLHASERLLLEDIQSKIRGEYIGRIQNKLKKTTNEWARAYLKNAIRNFVNPNKSDQMANMRILKEHADDVPKDEFYKYFNPSEYWAEEGSSILARRHDASGWIGKAKQWLSEFGEHVKNLFGLDNNSKVISGLNKMLKTTEGDSPMLSKKEGIHSDINKVDPEQVGDDPDPKELGYEPAENADVDPNMLEKPVFNKQTKDLGHFSSIDKGIENLMQSEYGLEKSIQHATREGIKITEDNDVHTAAFSKRGLANEARKTDRFEVVGPVEDYLYSNYSKFAKTPKEFLDYINTFFGNRNFLERMQTAWMLESPLSGKGELERGVILDQVANDKISGKAANKKLTAIANKYKILDWREYAESKDVDVAKIESKLKELDDKYNINDESFSELNEHTQAIRDRLQQRLIESGDIDPDDPYIDLYGWKWYVPLKGSPFGGGVDGNFDIIPSWRIALARLNKQMATMEGRNGVTEQPYTRLLVDLSRSADRVGNKRVLDATYNLLTSEGANGELALKKFGARIDVWHGRQKDGYTDENGKYVERLKAPAHGVIINDGNTHYVVTLPANSELLRGLVQMNNVKVPDAFSQGVSKATNVFARLYTTIGLVWQTSVGFARDISYVPLTIAVTRFDNPLQAIPFLLKYIPEVIKSYQALPTIIPTLLGKEGAIRAMAEANPDSYAGWIRRYEKAGGSNFFTSGFDIAGTQKSLLSRYEAQNGVMDLTKFGWKKVLEYTGNYANLLEQVSRIAAFKQLVKEGMSETEAAAQVRKILDYEQSGVYGRVINSYLAFFRVGATGTDVIRRAFTKSTGGFDKAKFAKWQLFMGALGYMGYLGGMTLMGKDDDGKYKIQKVNPDLLTQRAFFPVGDKIGSINLGLGMPQLLLAPGILAAAVGEGHITSKQALKSYLNMLERNGPTSPGGALGDNPTDYIASAAFGAVPTALRPIIDTSRNTSSFSSPIHTIDPDRNKFNSDQGYPNTPKQWKEIATWIREHSGGTIDLFPEDVKYWTESYGGRPAVDFTRWAFQSGNVSAGGEAPMGRLAGSFYVDTSHYMARDLFSTLDELAEDSKRYNHLVSSTMHDEGIDRDQAKSRVASIVNRDNGFSKRLQAYKDLKKAHADYNKAVNSMRDNKLLSDTRKQLLRKKLDTQLRTAVEKAQGIIEETKHD